MVARASALASPSELCGGPNQDQGTTAGPRARSQARKLSAKLNPEGAYALVPLAQRTNTASRPKIDLGPPCQTHAAVLGRVNRAVSVTSKPSVLMQQYRKHQRADPKAGPPMVVGQRLGP
jgi:hypothetical protein